MPLDTNVVGAVSGTGADVNALRQLLVVLGLDAAGAPEGVGGVRMFTENDAGAITGTAALLSPETDPDYRLRVSSDVVLDNITFNHTAQQTNRYRIVNTTLAMAETGGFLTTNSGSITTTTTAALAYSDNSVSLFGASQVYVEFTAAFTNTPVANTIIELMAFSAIASANPYAPSDGFAFRMTSAGFFGLRVNNSTETLTSVFTFTPTLNQFYKFAITANERELQFWIDDELYGSLDLVGSAVGSATFLQSYRWGIRHAIVGGAAGGTIQCKVSDVHIAQGGPFLGMSMGEQSSLQGLMAQQLYPGATLTTGSAALVSAQNYLNSANPTAAVPTNTTSALIASALGGQFWETDTLAVTTDGIIMSYQVANHSTTPTVRPVKLVVYGIKISSFVQTVLTGGGYVASWSLAFGHTAVSLATAEAATTKAPRRVALGLQTVASAAAALTLLADVQMRFDGSPIVVNPGEFIAVVKKKIGTAPSAGVIGHVITLDACWV